MSQQYHNGVFTLVQRKTRRHYHFVEGKSRPRPLDLLFCFGNNSTAIQQQARKYELVKMNMDAQTNVCILLEF